MVTEDQLAELERTLPPLFARSEVPKLTGNLFSAGYLANLDSRGEGPRRGYAGRKAFYTREAFLAFLRSRAERFGQKGHYKAGKDKAGSGGRGTN